MAEQRTVLIIENSESDRSVFRQFLLADSEISYQILETDSAAAGLALCRTHVLDGILLSAFDGFEFLTQLKAQTDGNFPPVIVVSDNDAATATTAFKNGVEDYLVRGQITPDGLRVAMQSAIANAQLRRKINEQLAEINGLPVSEHIGRTLREVLPEMVGQLEPLYRQVIESGEPILDLEVSGTLRAQPEVERHWLLSYYPQKDADDRVFGINVMVQEISEAQRSEVVRKQAEAEREQLLKEAQAARAEAEAANRSKDDFLAIVAHELRSPLNSIFGWARLLQTKPSDQATLNRGLQSIERSAKTQSQLIEDLLDISRMVQGNLRMDRVSVNLPFVIEAAIDMIRPLAESKQIQIKSNIDHAVSEVLGDSNRLQQVIWNLLTNAIKFTPENGQIDITLTQRESQAEICVKDTGKGINASFLPYVFDRFRQSQTNAPRSQDGLGLGLAIVRELIELHNGTIQAESPGDGQGATFTARLPLVDCCLPYPHSQGASEGFDQLQILVVDDEPDSLEFVKFLLEDEGATITTATSADEAIAAFQQLTPTLIISDIAMPLKDGYEMLREIRALAAGRHVPAIALTAYVDEEVRQRAFAAGYQIHLPKPLDVVQLIEAIGSLTKYH